MFKSFVDQGQHYFTRKHVAVPREPISGAAAWRSADLRADPSWRYTLSEPDLAELASALSGLHDAAVSMRDINRHNFPLPTLGPKLADWRRQLVAGRGVMLVSGLPVHELSEADAGLLFWAIGHYLGEPGAQNPDEELLGHVKDYAENDPTVRLYRTRENIDFHCDAADVVGLLCLRPALEGGQSRIVSTVALFNQLLDTHPELAPRLFEPFRLDLRDGTRPGRRPYRPIAPSCFDGKTLRTFYHSDYFRSVERHPGETLTAQERAILDFYDGCGNDPTFYFDMMLEAGDMQFVSNHTVAHARTAYTDSDDPALKRHLLRLWLSVE